MLALLLLLVQSPVTVQLNHDRFTVGDHARVYVQSEQDGYLVVLHADADGRVRVLFPLDPTDDDFIRGGTRFEVRARGDREAFQIEANDGSGTVLAAVAKDPFNFSSFTLNGHWDFRALGSPSSSVRDDPVVKLTDIAQRMAGDSSGQYDYDIATYVVNSNRVASRYGYYDPYAYQFGVGFYDPFCFDPFWGWASCFGYGWSYGFGGYYGGYGYPFGFGIGVVYRSGPGWRFPYTRYRPHPPMIFNTSRPARYIPMPTRSREPGAPAPTIARPQATPRSWSGGSRPSVSRGFGGGSPRSFGGSPSRSGGGSHSSGGGGRTGGGGGRRH